MSELTIILVIALLFFLLFKAISKQNEKAMPSVADDAFVDEYKLLFGTNSYEEIVNEREALAKYFNIERIKVNVNTKIADLAKSFSTTGGHLAVTDIIVDLYNLDYSDSVEGIELPETAGELINLFLSLKREEIGDVSKVIKGVRLD